MFYTVSLKLTDILVKYGCISKEDEELYSYGFRQLFMMILNIFITLCIGIVLNQVWQSIIFSIVYIPIRSFAGGYHAETPLKCTIFSTVMIFTVLLILKFITLPIHVILILWIVSFGIIFSLSPVENINKPLDTVEKLVYKKRTIFLLILDSAIIITLILFSANKIYLCMILSLFCLSIMLILGIIKNKMSHHKYK